MNLLARIFGSRQARDLRGYWPLVEEINAEFAPLEALSDSELRARTEELKARLAAGETINDLRVAAFATVKEACRRLKGRKWDVVGHEVVWDIALNTRSDLLTPMI